MKSKHNFITVGIETSCDETGVAVLRGNREMLASVVASSLKEHERFGGVVPEIASRHSLEYMQWVFEQALARAAITPDEINLIGVTRGPGLIGSLLVGVMFAKGLHLRLGVPLLGINHLEAHLVVNFIDGMGEEDPFVGLIVSGGHTALVYARGGKLTLLGQTKDDALGEAFDKVAKMLGLGYPGGPRIEKMAQQGNEETISLSCARLPGTLDFSFSGIKTSVLYYLKSKHFWENQKPDLCAAFQKTVFDIIIEKTLAAAHDKNVKRIVVGGGVSANQYFRTRLESAAKEQGRVALFPPMKYAIDNGAMIAKRTFDLYHAGEASARSTKADPSLAF